MEGIDIIHEKLPDPSIQLIFREYLQADGQGKSFVRWHVLGIADTDGICKLLERPFVECVGSTLPTC